MTRLPSLQDIPSLRSTVRRIVEIVVYKTRFLIHAVGFVYVGLQYHNAKGKAILNCYPRKPLPIYTAWAMARVCGFTLKRSVGKKTLLFLDSTYIPSSFLPAEAEQWINGTCRDIRKSTVAKKFEEVTHRRLFLDADFEGEMVEKSETNGVHSGRIVQGPLKERTQGHTYQRLVHNVTADGTAVEDLRVVVVGTVIALVFQKRRPIHRRFEEFSVDVKTLNPKSTFSHDEYDTLIRFARHIGLDFGEMDVLRDTYDKQLYVVDVNQTPVSPPITLPFRERVRALKIIGDVFEKEFLVQVAAQPRTAPESSVLIQPVAAR